MVSPVAMVYHACPVCGNKHDEQLLIHKHLRDLSKVDKQVVGYSKDPCKQCQEYMAMGLLIIEVDENKSTDTEPYRTGKVYVLKREAAERMFTEVFDQPYPAKSCCFMTSEVTAKLGITGENNAT